MQQEEEDAGGAAALVSCCIEVIQIAQRLRYSNPFWLYQALNIGRVQKIAKSAIGESAIAKDAAAVLTKATVRAGRPPMPMRILQVHERMHAPIRAHDTEDLPLQELFLGELGRLSYEKSLGQKQKQIEYDHIGRRGSVHHALSLPALKTTIYKGDLPRYDDIQ